MRNFIMAMGLLKLTAMDNFNTVKKEMERNPTEELMDELTGHMTLLNSITAVQDDVIVNGLQVGTAITVSKWLQEAYQLRYRSLAHYHNSDSLPIVPALDMLSMYNELMIIQFGLADMEEMTLNMK